MMAVDNPALVAIPVFYDKISKNLGKKLLSRWNVVTKLSQYITVLEKKKKKKSQSEAEPNNPNLTFTASKSQAFHDMALSQAVISLLKFGILCILLLTPESI